MTMSHTLPLLDDASCLSEPALGDAGFGALETVRGRLPLAAMDVRARIDGLLAQIVVRQTYVNVLQEPLEATYIFPLPDRAAVAGFRMEVAGRVIDGLLRERGQARHDYNQAIRQGHRASIAEEERPGVFTLRAGNLMPGDRATVEFTMGGILPYVDGEVTFRFPLVVAPRYIPGTPLDGPSVGDGTAVDTDAVPDASRISPPVLLPGFPNPVRLSLAVDLYHSGVPMEDIRASLHATSDESSPEQGICRIILKPGARLDRDFILRYRLGGPSARTTLSLHPDASSPDANEGTFALTIVPPTASNSGAPRMSSRPRPRDLAFVLDRSGSMGGWKMVAARRAMAHMIDTLTEADRFLVFAFDDQIESPPQIESGLVPATSHNRYRAVEFLAKLESRGGTEIAHPLRLAVDKLEKAQSKPARSSRISLGGDSQRDRILVLVTDGQVGNEDQVLETVGSRIRGIRIFTLGIDQAVNEGFLRRLSELGSAGGSCELVESDDRLDAVMESIHRRIDTPILTDVMLEAGQSGLEILADSVVPERPPAVFAGSPLLLLGRYRGRPQTLQPLSLHAKTNEGSPYSGEVVPFVRDNPAIASAWARGRIRALEDRYAAGLGDRADLERAITATSLRFGVLCRFTAYVAIDRAAVVNEGGEVHQITQPVETPAGWALAHPRMIAGRAAAGHVGSVADTAEMCMFLDVPCAARAPELPPPLSTPARGLPPSARRGRAFKKSTRAKPPAGSVPPTPPASVGELIQQAGYVLLEEIGRDGYGVIHKAKDPHGDLVALRLLKVPFDTGNARKFAQLEKKLKALRHPGIVPILALIADPSVAGRVVAVVSELTGERSLKTWHGRTAALDPVEIARLVLALVEALQFAAKRGVSHGLLTPERIGIGTDGVPRIEGFGLAMLCCHTSLPSSGGTGASHFAPPIQNPSSQTASEQSDIYSLGAILCWLLTDQLPVASEGSGASPAHVTSRPRGAFWKAAAGTPGTEKLDPQIPGELQAISARAIEPDPTARYLSWIQFAADLRNFLGIKQSGWFGLGKR